MNGGEGKHRGHATSFSELIIAQRGEKDRQSARTNVVLENGRLTKNLRDHVCSTRKHRRHGTS